ncbi:Leucine-rich repeats and immunoglobulin-like domains protein sma-10 [Candida viswanathii]|uniref:Leucine-rich repeats and immunoglobulin-like domains protein sma-10 n=1 Tax=Candida viswanathii TaxID=5486 RepID=A0A367XQ69_9ASCO|nr:Leucine-rich repeats and immunoglobulin-like domains protein sma-10 [Candida viswanathii]
MDLADLPTEVLDLIFSFIPTSDLYLQFKQLHDITTNNNNHNPPTGSIYGVIYKQLFSRTLVIRSPKGVGYDSIRQFYSPTKLLNALIIPSFLTGYQIIRMLIDGYFHSNLRVFPNEITLILRYMDSIEQIEYYMKILEQLSFDKFYSNGIRTINFQIIYDANPTTELIALHSKIKFKLEDLIHKSDKILIQTRKYSKWYQSLNPYLLKNLKEMYLWNNDIDNFAITGFFKCVPADLRVLELSGNHITDLQGLVLPKSLERLHLSTNMINSLEGVDFSKPKNLQLLDISMNRLVGFPRNLQFPNSTKRLMMSHNEIEFINQEQVPENLQFFTISSNCLTSLDHIYLPASLIMLDLSDNSFSSFREDFFSECVNMKKLNLAINSIDDLDDLGQLPPNLEELILDYNEIDNYDFTNILTLKKLKKLAMAGTGLMFLKDIKFPDTLLSLVLKDNEINELADVDFGSSLEFLDLSYNKLESFNTHGLRIPPSLKKLDLSENCFQDLNNFTIPASITTLYFNMSSLSLNNKLLARFPDSLEVLELIRAIPKSMPELNFKKFRHLASLNLQKNGITSIEKIDLPDGLQILDLSQNCIRQINWKFVSSSIRHIELRGNPIDNQP